MKVKGFDAKTKEDAKPAELTNTAVSYYKDSKGVFQLVKIQYNPETGDVGTVEKVGPTTIYREEAVSGLKKQLVFADLI